MENWQKMASARISRRAALSIAAGSALLIACGENRDNSSNKLKKSDGEWGPHQIAQLAESLSREKDFPLIAYAGELLTNNQAGVPSFSQDNPIFKDTKLKIKTYPHINRGDNPATGRQIDSVGPLVNYEYGFPHPDIPRATQKISGDGYAAVDYKMLVISSTKTKGESEMALKFRVASELLYPKAADDILDHVLRKELLTEKPQVPDQPGRALLIRILGNFYFSEPNQRISVQDMNEYWSQFMLVPDFLKAKDKGLFTGEDLRSMSDWDKSSMNFLKSGALAKNPDGSYSWTGNKDQRYEAWGNEGMRRKFPNSTQPLIPTRDIKRAATKWPDLSNYLLNT